MSVASRTRSKTAAPAAATGVDAAIASAIAAEAAHAVAGLPRLMPKIKPATLQYLEEISPALIGFFNNHGAINTFDAFVLTEQSVVALRDRDAWNIRARDLVVGSSRFVTAPPAETARALYDAVGVMMNMRRDPFFEIMDSVLVRYQKRPDVLTASRDGKTIMMTILGYMPFRATYDTEEQAIEQHNKDLEMVQHVKEVSERL